MQIPFEIEKLRNEILTADEWAAMVDIMRKSQHMTIKDWQEFPELDKWMEEACTIVKERAGKKCHLQGCLLAKKE